MGWLLSGDAFRTDAHTAFCNTTSTPHGQRSGKNNMIRGTMRLVSCRRDSISVPQDKPFPHASALSYYRYAGNPDSTERMAPSFETILLAHEVHSRNENFSGPKIFAPSVCGRNGKLDRIGLRGNNKQRRLGAPKGSFML